MNQIIPWIAGDDGWWAAVNLHNHSAHDTISRIEESDAAGKVISTRDVTIKAYGNHGWTVAPGVRTIIIEGDVYVTAHQGNPDVGMTELKARNLDSKN